MISTDIESMTHPQDGDLLRYLDGECDPIALEDIERHVENCERCLKALALFKGTSDRLNRLLSAHDEAPPLAARDEFLARAERIGSAADHRRARTARQLLARAAIIALVLFGLGLAVTPVRAWLVRQTAALQQAFFKQEPHQQQAVFPPGPKTPSTVSFIPAAGAFSIEVAVPQNTGELTLTILESQTATAQVLGDIDDEGLLVMPSRLRITNSSTSAADYAVTLPSQLTEIRLSIGGTQTLTVSTAGLELPARWSFSLRIDR